MNSFPGTKAVFGLLIAFFLVVNIGDAFAAGMIDGGTTRGCPYMGLPVLCTMSPLTHISEWQQAFAATAERVSAELFALLALCLVFLPSLYAPPREARALRGYLYHTPPITPHRERLTRWLSLFENSPAF